MSFNELEKVFDIKISDENLFERALTHTSCGKNNYERLEFFGDAVLKLYVTEVLYNKYPNEQEGKLTKIRSIIVSDAVLAEVAMELGLNRFIKLSKHAEKDGERNRSSINACVLEALIGAFYIDGKQDDIKNFLAKIFEDKIEEINEKFAIYNAKETLQEYTQGLNKELPQYRLVQEFGPKHSTNFEVEVEYAGNVLATCTGKSKKEAEQKCAYEACKKLGVINGK